MGNSHWLSQVSHSYRLLRHLFQHSSYQNVNMCCVLAMVKLLLRVKIIAVQSVEAFRLVGQSQGLSLVCSKSGSDKQWKSPRSQVSQSRKCQLGRCISLGWVSDWLFDAAQPYLVSFTIIYRVGQLSLVKSLSSPQGDSAKHGIITVKNHS